MTRPKAMMPVAAKPIVQHIIEGLREKGGVVELKIVVGHLAARVINNLEMGAS
jgi:NDP-sugar pyrophosphorylase family protein